jgi:hypothetical protein
LTGCLVGAKGWVRERASLASWQGIDKGKQGLDFFGPVSLVVRGSWPQADVSLKSGSPEKPLQGCN